MRWRLVRSFVLLAGLGLGVATLALFEEQPQPPVGVEFENVDHKGGSDQGGGSSSTTSTTSTTVVGDPLPNCPLRDDPRWNDFCSADAS